jgi:hypothetical protein
MAIDKQALVREAAEVSLETFIRLIAPKQLLGGVHIELLQWMTRQEARSHQLILLPRDHQKSRMIAYRVAWEITRKPWIRVMYISSTSGLAEKQLSLIKNILTSPIYQKYWPEMIHPEEGKREKWTLSEISVDHPRRKEEGVAEPTIFTGGLTTSLTGFHCDIAVLDDVVVQENAYSPEGRSKVESQYSLLASIEGADSQQWTVGTHYHPKDLYMTLKSKKVEMYGADGDLISEDPLYEVFERVVEDSGDGSGQYLWPRQQRQDGVWFGFDQNILARKKAQYLDKSQFRAQYYNDPNDVSESPIPRESFQYYDRKFLTRNNGVWYFNGKRLNVFAAIDFAYSLRQKADYTALVVIGIDGDKNIYLLDIERVKTDKISDYYDLIIRYHVKWDFRKLRAETTAAQKTIVRELKNSYLKPNGIALSIDEHSPTRHDGNKAERIHAVLQPRYQQGAIWHYVGGECQNLEEELVLKNPPHDDIKDALASSIEIAIPPMGLGARIKERANVIYHNRFGGVAYR